MFYFSGGETIRRINQESGAHVELQKHPGPTPYQKLFSITGTPDQIQHAIQMIREKVGSTFVSCFVVFHFRLCCALAHILVLDDHLSQRKIHVITK